MTEPNNYHEIIKFLYEQFENERFDGKDSINDDYFKELVKIGWVEKIKSSGKLSKTSCDLLEDILIK